MSDRAVEIAGFLAETGWDKADEMPLPADFSTRRFARFMRSDGKPARAILLDAENERNNEQFVAIAGLLRAVDISAPEIYAADLSRGLILMEDFGSRNVGRSVDAGADAMPFYRRAMDVLIHLHQRFNPATAKDMDLPVFGGGLFASQVELFLDMYFPFVHGREADRAEGESFRAAWRSALKGIEALPQSLMLRDYMLDNLMDLSGREGLRAMGLLDFQDGGFGPAAYDLASLCEAVRRDCGENLLDEMIDYYSANMPAPLAREELRRACRVLSAQRHMRVLGIIARLAHEEGRREKLVFVPRIQNYLDWLLREEALRPVQTWMQANGF